MEIKSTINKLKCRWRGHDFKNISVERLGFGLYTQELNCKRCSLNLTLDRTHIFAEDAAFYRMHLDFAADVTSRLANLEVTNGCKTKNSCASI